MKTILDVLYIKKGIFLGILFFITSSCINKDTPEKEIQDYYKAASTTLKDSIYFSPDTLFIRKLDDTVYAAATRKSAGGNELIVLRNLNKRWMEYLRFDDVEKILEIEFVKIDTVKYVYYSMTKTYFPGVTRTLVLAELNNFNNKLSVIFRGDVKQPPTLPHTSWQIKINSKLLDYIKTTTTYRQLLKDAERGNNDLLLPMNSGRAWFKNNRHVHKLLEAKPDSSIMLKILMYDYDLRWIYGGGDGDRTENNFYIINSYFKSCLLGYDKKISKHFLMWFPESVYGWIVKVVFTSTHVIAVQDNNDKYYEINLKEKRIKRLTQNPFND